MHCNPYFQALKVMVKNMKVYYEQFHNFPSNKSKGIVIEMIYSRAMQITSGAWHAGVA